MKIVKKKKKGFTLIELLAVIVVLAIIMIIAIPNILNTMSTSKRQSLKVYAEKMFNEAQKKYEEEKLTNPTGVGATATYKFATLAPTQNKYKGCVKITGGPVNYTMKINISDTEYKITDKTLSDLNTASNIVAETSKSDSEDTVCSRTS